jgi:glycosyltransferase involved in cell wall biosynthesis
MKICFISHSARLGGAELVLLETIEILQENGIQCCAVLPARGPLASELEKLRVPLYVTSYALWTAPDRPSLLGLKVLLNIALKSIFLAWRAWRWNCDIIYSNTATVCVGAFAATLLGRPHVWHLHEFGSKSGLHFIVGERWSHRIIDRLSDLVIAPSYAAAREFRRWLHHATLRVIYCSLHRALDHDDMASPTALERDQFAGNGRLRCVVAGAITENKGQEDALLALQDLRRQQVKAELLVIGDGDGAYCRRLHRLVAQAGLQDCVGFLGQLDNPMAQLRAADVVLVCSRSEGFGRVTAEAMLAGKPVIGANNTATGELIQDGCNGLLYPTADAHALAAKIIDLRAHPEVASRLAHNGQAWARRLFTRDRYREQLLPLLTGLLSCPR